MIIVFVVVRYLILLRKWVTETKLGLLGKFPVRAPSGTIEDGHGMAEPPKSGVHKHGGV